MRGVETTCRCLTTWGVYDCSSFEDKCVAARSRVLQQIHFTIDTITGNLNKHERLCLKCIRSTPLGQKHLFLIQRKGFSVGNDWRGERDRCSFEVSGAPCCDPDGCTTAQAAGLQHCTSWGDGQCASTHTHTHVEFPMQST